MSDFTMNYVGSTPFAVASDHKSLDVVFLHGITGDSFTTWAIDPTSGTFWPRWLAEDFEAVSVHSAGYESSLLTKALTGEGASISDLATMLLDRLLSRSHPAAHLVLIAHSLGGLIVKQMLRKCADSANPEHKNLLKSVRGLVFISTPHQGAAAAKALDSVVHKLLSKVAKQLAYGEDQLFDLNEWFRVWASSSNVRLASYYETKNTKGIRIVDKVSANPNVLGCDPIGILSDHIDICKPSSREAQLYKSVAKFLSDALKGSNGHSKKFVPGATSERVKLNGLSSNVDPVTFSFEDIDPEIFADYQYFTTTSPDDRRTLAEKLTASGREYEIRTAERAKERFNMALQRHIAQPSAIARFTKLMSEVETRFNRHVREAICTGATIQKVNRIVQREVIDTTMAARMSDSAPLTASLIESALYYLTGNCHIRWENVQD